MDLLAVLTKLRPGESFSFREDQDAETLENVVCTCTLPTLGECQTYWDEPLKPEVATKALRRKRDRLIRESDPYSLPDFPHASEEVRQAWLTYRQALRDLPSTTEDPSNPTWPEAPGSN